jgi:hypothetical protein
MLAKLRDKSGKYGAPGLPIVVAVNLVSSFGDERAAEQALFGSFAIRAPIGGKASSAETFRQQDGFWMRRGRPLATRVSAVLEGPALRPWTIAKKWPRLWLNPWALHPLDIQVPLPRGVGSDTGQIEYVEADMTPAPLFGLAEDWPGPVSQLADGLRCIESLAFVCGRESRRNSFGYAGVVQIAGRIRSRMMIAFAQLESLPTRLRTIAFGRPPPGYAQSQRRPSASPRLPGASGR